MGIGSRRVMTSSFALGMGLLWRARSLRSFRFRLRRFPSARLILVATEVVATTSSLFWKRLRRLRGRVPRRPLRTPRGGVVCASLPAELLRSSPRPSRCDRSVIGAQGARRSKVPSGNTPPAWHEHRLATGCDGVVRAWDGAPPARAFSLCVPRFAPRVRPRLTCSSTKRCLRPSDGAQFALSLTTRRPTTRPASSARPLKSCLRSLSDIAATAAML